ncbi:YhgE/Pip family protein [Pseudolactococcus plantarum]|uniref:Phage infection protein n=1 Tax=Pseudolactococcus plantarum TaxID=1365 RepID=A0A2A5S1W3_9LACT|nr:YhgE/Pip domain-containing protein [Lactococcus plantarum]PCS07449.1 Phage infection protein [Lactococcus plantarum]HCN74056.1 YhgE/Pip domain-containing protein [Lactococcus sp.]
MFKKEWQAILKNKLFIGIIISLMLIPALYNLIFLSSMWDPYGKLSDLSVAVVNQDKSAQLNGKAINLGKAVTDNMVEGKALDYHVVTDDTAQKGLKNGDYFMVVTFPSDFSENAGSLVGNEPKKTTIHYQTSVGHNFIASKMSDSAMEKLKQSVANNITETYTKTIFKNLSTLSTGVGKAADGSGQLVNGSKDLASGSNEITTNLAKLSESSLAFKDGADTLNVGLGQYVAGVNTLKAGTGEFKTAVSSYTDGAAQLANGTNQLATGTAGLAAGAAELSNGVSRINELVDGSAKLSNGLQELSGNIDTNKLNDLKNGIAQLQTGLDAYNESVQHDQSPQGQAIVNDLKVLVVNIGTIQAQQTNKLTQLKATKAYQDNPSEQATLEGLISVSPELINNLSSAVADIQTQLQQLQDKQVYNKRVVADITNGAAEALKGATGTIDGLTTVKATLDQALIPGAGQLASGIAQLNTQLTTGTAQLSAGAAKLNDSTAQLNTGAQSLVSHNAELTSGSAKLADGANQLTQNAPALLGGVGKLASGASQLSDGSGKLATGSGTLTSGINSLTTGATTLNSGLLDAKTKLAANQTTDTNAAKIASPVQLAHTDQDKSANNGTGMAPYMMAVALFVGAISTNMIISGSLSGALPKSRKDYLLGRIGVNGLISLGSGTLVYLAVHILGLSANHEVMMFGFTLLVSFCFMMVVTFLNTWLGKPGAFLTLILLLLQLGASAGTYPLALTSKFFQVLNPWMPMTYAVSGFREVISLTGKIGQETTLLLVLSSVLVILIGLTGYKKAKS